jgi:hypothetical protein
MQAQLLGRANMNLSHRPPRSAVLTGVVAFVLGFVVANVLGDLAVGAAPTAAPALAGQADVPQSAQAPQVTPSPVDEPTIEPEQMQYMTHGG